MHDLAYLNPPAKLPAILDRSAKLPFPMPSEPKTGAMLRVLAATKPGGQLLELGTETGVSTSWLLVGMEGAARLTSDDIDPASKAVAREILGDDPTLQVVTTGATVFLRQQVQA